MKNLKTIYKDTQNPKRDSLQSVRENNVRGVYLISGFDDEYGAVDESLALMIIGMSTYIVSPFKGILRYDSSTDTWLPVTRLASEKISTEDLEDKAVTKAKLADAVAEQIDQFQMIPQGADLLNVSLGKGVYFTQDEKYLNIPTGITGNNPMCMIVDNNGSRLLLGTSTTGDFISARKNASGTSWIICNYYNEIAAKQDSTDNTLATTSKTIVGAINEVNTLAKSKASSSVATVSENGLMASADKVKLDGVATGAQVNVLDGMTVNGEAATIANKKIAVANGTSKGTFTVGGKTVTIGGLDKVDNTSDAEKQVFEANLKWGGKNLANSFSPVDAAMLSELSANRFAYLNLAGVEFEYSRDGGETWADYEADDWTKRSLFSTGTQPINIGKDSSIGVNKTNYQVRVTITSDLVNIYTVLNKIAIFISTNGSNGCWCSIGVQTKANADAGNDVWESRATKVPIAGSTGWNIINIVPTITYSSSSSQYQKWRFTFGVGSHETELEIKRAGLLILKIAAFGGNGWKTPSNLAKSGHAYSMDAYQNCTFPAKVTSVGLDATNQRVTRVATPTDTTDAANKAYVDGLVGNISTVLTNIIGE